MQTKQILRGRSGIPLLSAPHIPPHRIRRIQSSHSDHGQAAEWPPSLYSVRVCDWPVKADLCEEYEQEEDTSGYEFLEMDQWVARLLWGYVWVRCLQNCVARTSTRIIAYYTFSH
ncbi:hypothetical protein ACHAW6_001323 [Cyclotella cf. meneghiniana]